MMMRTFQAPSLREAMKKVKDELGPNAVILVTREVKAQHLGQATLFEVTAASDDQDPLAALRPLPDPGESLLSYGPVRTKPTPPPPPASAAPPSSPILPLEAVAPAAPPEEDASADVLGSGEIARTLLRQIDDLKRELQGLRTARTSWEQTTHSMDELRGEVGLLSRRLEHSPGGAAELQADPLVNSLVEAGVDPTIALGVVTRARGRLTQRGFGSAPPPKEIDLKGEIARAIVTSSPLWSRRERVVAAFIGPTGVGKTTTLAKVAAAAALMHRKRVGLVAADTYRIAGIDQVKTYANLIGLPVRQARDRKELGQALVSFRDLDLVLVDTTGRNPWSDEALTQVSGMFDETRIERHLCVSATTRPQDIQDIVRRYEATGITSIIVTKVDEARGPGAVLTASWGSRHPVSHLCTGQQVPEDIEAANGERIAAQILARADAVRGANG